MFISTFSQRFKYLRASAGFTQDEMSKRLDVAHSTIGMYERGERNPSIDKLIEIAKIFNVSVNFLLGYDSNSNFKDESMEKWIAAGENMTKIQREKWLQAFKILNDN